MARKLSPKAPAKAASSLSFSTTAQFIIEWALTPLIPSLQHQLLGAITALEQTKGRPLRASEADAFDALLGEAMRAICWLPDEDGGWSALEDGDEGGDIGGSGPATTPPAGC